MDAWHWLAAGMWALSVVSLAAWVSLLARPSRLRRCPKCWYDMSGAPPATDDRGREGWRCSECGRVTIGERRLRRRRHKGWLAAAACVLALGGYACSFAPAVRAHGWYAAIPDWVLVRIAPVDRDAWYGWRSSARGATGLGGMSRAVPQFPPLLKEIGRRQDNATISTADEIYYARRVLTACPGILDDAFDTREVAFEGARILGWEGFPDTLNQLFGGWWVLRLEGVEGDVWEHDSGWPPQRFIDLGRVPKAGQDREIQCEVLLIPRSDYLVSGDSPTRFVWKGTIGSLVSTGDIGAILYFRRGADVDAAITEKLRPALWFDQSGSPVVSFAARPADIDGVKGYWSFVARLEVLHEESVVATGRLNYPAYAGTLTYAPQGCFALTLSTTADAPGDARPAAADDGRWRLRIVSDVMLAASDPRGRFIWDGDLTLPLPVLTDEEYRERGCFKIIDPWPGIP